MIYSSTITSSSLRVRESRVIADLLLRRVNAEEWKWMLLEQNSLKIKSLESIKRISGLLRARLEPMGEGLWEMVRDGDQGLAKQAVFAGAVKNSRVLGDFLDVAVRDQRAVFASSLEPSVWSTYLDGCRGCDPDMPEWSDGTISRLRSTVFTMLAQAGYLRDTRGLALQNVFVDQSLAAYLRERGESYVLRCMEVME
jgi:hypothetical protein